MKNNIYILILLIFFSTYSSWIYAGEQFNFDVTEIEIFEKGNKFKGTKRGKITSNNGVELDADTFEYDKTKNVLNAKGNVILKDLNNDTIILSNDIKLNPSCVSKNTYPALESSPGFDDPDTDLDANQVIIVKGFFIFPINPYVF